MPLPITIPYTFATATTSIPLSQLDSDFSTVANAINGIGNGTNALSNVVITGGTIDNVAIGATTSTTGKFTTITATTGNITTINATTTNSATIRSDANLTFQSNGTTTAMTITTGQNVGIGNTAPAYRFVSVGGGIQLSGGTSAQEGVRIQRASGVSSFTGINNDNNAYNALSFATSASEAMRIDTSGNVGIGTTSSSYPLTVRTSGTSTTSGGNIATRIESNGSGYAATLQFSDNVANSSSISMVGSATAFLQAGTERMRIDSAGNVGIGGTPFAYGAGYTDLWVQASTTPVLDLAVGSTRTGSFYASSTAVNFGTIASVPLIINTANAERMRVDSSGNVGIGTSAPAAALSVVTQTTALSGTGNAYGLYMYPTSTGTEYIDAITSSTGNTNLIMRTYNNGTYYQLKLDSSGYLTCAGVYSATVGATNRDVYVDNTGLIGYVSSIRASKTNIEPLSDVSWLYQLNPVSFNYRKKDEDGGYTNEADGEIQYGMIAEEVETVRPDLCFYNEVDGEQQLQGISYSKLVPVLLKAIQELEARVAQLEAK